MVHCQGQQHHENSLVLEAKEATELMLHASHRHASAAETDPALNLPFDIGVANAEPCEACDHCCSIHCMPLPVLSATTEIDCHDKVLQNTYFHTSGIVSPQERPPKTV